MKLQYYFSDYIPYAKEKHEGVSYILPEILILAFRCSQSKVLSCFKYFLKFSIYTKKKQNIYTFIRYARECSRWFSLFLFPHPKNWHCHLPDLSFETKSVSLFLEYKHPENSKFQGYHWENLEEVLLLSAV